MVDSLDLSVLTLPDHSDAYFSLVQIRCDWEKIS